MRGEAMAEIDRVAQVMMDDIIEARDQMTINANYTSWLTHIGQNLRGGLGRPIPDFTLPDDRKKETIFIVGPGASLWQYREKLPMLREVGTVVAQPTAYAFLHEIGLEPDAIVAVDRMHDQPENIKQATCPVIAPTTVHPALAEEHPNTYFYTLYQGDGTRHDPRWGQWNMILHWVHHGAIGAHGWCSLGDVTNTEVQIFGDVVAGKAPFEGWDAKRIVLVGIDRSYWHGFGRSMSFGSDHERMPKHVKNWTDIQFRGVTTDVAMTFYIQLLYKWWRTFPEIPLYRFDDGPMKEIPFVGLAKILAGKYPKPLSARTIEKRMGAFLDHEFLEVMPQFFGSKADIAAMRAIAERKAQGESVGGFVEDPEKLEAPDAGEPE